MGNTRNLVTIKRGIEAKVVSDFSQHELKLIFTAVRRYQRDMSGNPLYADDYAALGRILTELQPLAFAQTYLQTQDGPAHSR